MCERRCQRISSGDGSTYFPHTFQQSLGAKFRVADPIGSADPGLGPSAVHTNDSFLQTEPPTTANLPGVNVLHLTAGMPGSPPAICTADKRDIYRKPRNHCMDDFLRALRLILKLGRLYPHIYAVKTSVAAVKRCLHDGQAH